MDKDNDDAVMVRTIDGRIWKPAQLVLDVHTLSKKTDQIVINLNEEGACAKSLGLYDLLDSICGQLSIDSKKITIQTRNQVESHCVYHIKKGPPYLYMNMQHFWKENKHELLSKDFSNIKHFGMFIGRSNFPRLWLASQIDARYQPQRLMSFHYDKTLEFHRPHVGLEDMFRWNVDNDVLETAVKFLNKCPLKIDTQSYIYPINIPINFELIKLHSKFFCEVVCETYSMGNSFFPTEKIWKSIITRTPFIAQGPQQYLVNLKKLGFKTFSQWWNEGYSEMPWDYQPAAILKLIQKIANSSPASLEDMYHDMMPTLDHNFQTFMSLTPAHFKKVFQYD